jgi:hypothetical protein
MNLRLSVLLVLLLSGATVPICSWQFDDFTNPTKLGFFGTGLFIGFTTHVTARPEDWRDPAIVSVAIAVPAGLIMIDQFDAHTKRLGLSYRGENRGIDLALGVFAGACAGKTVRYVIKGAAWLACMLAHKVRGPQQQQKAAQQ